jgi:hypothetical protein
MGEGLLSAQARRASCEHSAVVEGPRFRVEVRGLPLMRQKAPYEWGTVIIAKAGKYVESGPLAV